MIENPEEYSSGTEVRNFYEDLVNITQNRITEESVSHNVSLARTPFQSEPCKDEDDFLKNARNGNIRQLKLSIENGIDINCCDSFGWTALMCAAYSGQYDIVSYLINQGANINKCDYEGLSAFDYAMQGSIRCFDLLNKLSVNLKSSCQSKDIKVPSASKDSKTNSVSKAVFCEQCQEHFHGTSLDLHFRSTVHLFNQGVQLVKSAPYKIPQENVGYQLMVKSGWDENSGLGSRSQGQKQPVSTNIKLDRRGLGYRTKLTNHVTKGGGSNVRNSAAITYRHSSEKSKRTAAGERAKMKQWERAMRRYLNSD